MKLFTLLCCINPTGSMDDIDEFTFYQMVNPIVPVINIKIFDKTSQVKAFVQIESEELAELAIKDLHGKQMNIGKIKVFVSHKKFVAFDKSLPEILAQANRSSLEHVDVQDFVTKKPAPDANPYLNNSLAGFKNKIQSYSSWKMHVKPINVPNFSDKVLYSKQSQLDYDVSPSIYVKKKLAQFVESEATFVKNKQDTEKIAERNIKSAKQSSFIKVANIDMKNVSCQMLFNLFGCFGNVLRLLIHESLGFAVLEYQNSKTATIAIKYTDCIKLCGKTLNVSLYSGPDLFDEANLNKSSKTTVYINQPENFRFANNSDDQITPPSRILKFANLPSSVSLANMRALVSKIHQPVNITVEKDKDPKFVSFLVEFKFLYEGFKTLTTLHNTSHDENNLSVSFSQRKSNTM